MKIGEKRATQIAEIVTEKLGNVTVSVNTVTKNNGQKKIGLLIEDSTGISPVIYLDDMKVRGLTEAAERVLMLYSGSAKADEIDSTTITDWNKAKENLVLALVNKSTNEKWLKEKEIIYKDFLDLAIIYKVVIQIGSQTGATTVDKKLLNRWGITEEELDRAARESSPKKAPVNNPTLMNILNDAGISAPMMPEPFTIVTNKAAANGAAVILYDGVLDALSKTKGGDFYIIPSSIHEVLAIDTFDGSPAALNNMIRSVNETQVAPEEVLADHAYFYDASAKELKIA